MADGFGLYTFVEPSDVERIRYVARTHPKAIEKAWNGVTLRAANTLRKVMRDGGGQHGVPAFESKHWVSETLHPGRPFGGDLPRRFIARWRKPGSRGTVQYIGFIDRAPFAAKFGEFLQTAEHRKMTVGESRWLAYRLKQWPRFPYRRPARPLIEPFADELPRVFKRHLVPYIERELKRELKRNAK